MAHFVVAQLPPHPTCHMARCAKCFLSTNGPFVNLGIEADLGQNNTYANLYLCAACLIEIGGDIGMITPAKADALKAEAAASAVRVANAEGRLAAYEAIDAAFKAHADAIAATETPAPATETPAPIKRPRVAKVAE